MESLQKSMMEMQTSFTAQLAEFQQSLERATPNSTVAALGAEFTLFKKFILTSLSSLQRQADLLQQECDRLEMCGRRKILLVHGVPEKQNKEDPGAELVKLFAEHLNITLPLDALRRCNRMGRASTSKTRPILVKFASIEDRDRLWFSKTGFKGTGITMSEFLTKPRHDTFVEARRRLGVSKCWTRNGIIVITAADGSHRRITTLGELDLFSPDPATSPPASEPAAKAVKAAGIAKSKQKPKK